MSSLKKFVPGYKIGRLTFIKMTQPSSNGKRQGIFKCDCGVEKIIKINNVLGKTNSCGCLKAELIRTRMRKSIEHLASVSSRNACKRHTPDTDLTINDVKSIIFSNCFYCEKSPNEVGTIYKRAISDGRTVRRIGIDRIDNNRGYYKNNVVPACVRCNYLKRTFSVNELYELLLIFTKNLKKLVKE